jgi:hypothetical protein
VQTRYHLNALMEPWYIYPNWVGTVEIMSLSPRTRGANESTQHTGGGIGSVEQHTKKKLGPSNLPKMISLAWKKCQEFFVNFVHPGL